MRKKSTVIAILPAYNAARTVVDFVFTLPRSIFSELILVDDSSSDGTFAIAKTIRGLTVYKTPRNLGYGGNLKYCLSTALRHGADIVIELHPDGEYKPDGIQPALGEVRRGAQLVLGNRLDSDPVAAGMRPEKFIITRWLSAVDNAVLGTHIPDLHQGFRVYTRDLLTRVPYGKNSDGYIFSFEIIAQAVFFGMRVSSVPVSVAYTGAKRGASIWNSFVYTMKTLHVLFELFLARMGFPMKHFTPA